jgi:hypothetical protein
MEKYSSLKRKAIPTTWMSLVNISHLRLTIETNQTPKDKYCVIPHRWGTYSSQGFLIPIMDISGFHMSF